jgi:hypothetical protein
MKKSRNFAIFRKCKKSGFFCPRGVFSCTPDFRPSSTAETSKKRQKWAKYEKIGDFFSEVTFKNRALRTASFFKKKVSGWKNVKF